MLWRRKPSFSFVMTHREGGEVLSDLVVESLGEANSLSHTVNLAPNAL
jgi:hypothetical protein